MIFYLSCTGNTQWAATQLAEATNEELVAIADVVQGDCRFTLKENERVGFCFPVHGWKLQGIICEFLDKLTISNASHHYTYALLTAGDSAGEVLDQFEAKLKLKGMTLQLGTCLIMPESYIGLPFMDVDTDLREAEKKSLAAMELRKFAELAVYRRSTKLKYERGYTPRIYSRVIGPFFHRYLITDKRFHVDSSKCNGCGKCAKHCPVGNIQITDGQPQWQHNGRCMTCFACYHYCPQRAIDFWHFTKGKGQYYFSHNKKNKKINE